MVKSFQILVVILFAFVLQLQAEQINTSAKTVPAIRTDEQITIDGKLDEQIWQRPGFTELKQENPDQGDDPSQKTEVWIAYDDQAIYFGGRMYDTNPDSIYSRLVRRDFVWGDPSDGILLYLDSYRDKRNGYFFYVNAAGSVADGLLENDNKQTDLSWDAVWEGVPVIDKDGWTVEMRIPYSQIRFKEGDMQEWGINVERYISRRNETIMIAYTPRNESGFASRFPGLTGLQGLSPSKGLELLPYITGRAEYVGNDPLNPFNNGKRYVPGAGLDLKAGLGTSLILNATINPDFGQVEVDPAVVNLSDVETSFQEKRPFFTEGVSIFRFGQGGANNNVNMNWSNPSIFYSRRIGRNPQGYVPPSDYVDMPNGTHIIGAGKISGQVFDDWKIGTIHAVTRREFARIDQGGIRSDYQVEPLTYYGVARLQRDFNSGAQGLGLLTTYTNRLFNDNALSDFINKEALVAGMDGWTYLDEERTYVLTGWGSTSHVRGSTDRMISLQRGPGHYFQRPDVSYLGVDSSATSLTGYAGRLIINKNRGEFSFNTGIGVISPKYEVNDLGYSAFSDVVNGHFFAAYRFNTPTEYYRNFGINAATFTNFDFGGNNTALGFRLGSYITLPIYYGGSLSFTYNPQTYSSRRTRGGPLTVNPHSKSFEMDVYSDGRQWWSVYAYTYMRTGDDYDSKYFESGIEFKVSPSLTLSVGPQVQVDNHQAQWIGSLRDNSATETYNRRYLFASLDQTTFSANIRADWIISPKLSFQVYMQPLVSSGKYSSFKSLRRPKSFDFLKYGEEGSTVTKLEGAYQLDVDGAGPVAGAVIGDPDFSYISLRGNAVLRWEYMPGSTVYFVWTQSREGIDPNGEFSLGRSMDNLVSTRPDNIFMIKFNYWLGM